MNIGKFNTKVNLEKRVYSKNPLVENTFNPHKSIWCYMENITTKEKINAESLNVKTSKKITIRYRKELDLDYNENSTKDFRITYKEKCYNIVYIYTTDEKDFMELLLEVE